MDEDRIRLAEEFLREAVYRSRESRPAALNSPSPSRSTGNCGLGERPAVDLELTRRGLELLGSLFGPAGSDAGRERIRTAMSEWVLRQDALDRKRNHFLKEFRARNGFDRTTYPPATLAEFEAGLARINAEEDSARRAIAEKLLATAG